VSDLGGVEPRQPPKWKSRHGRGLGRSGVSTCPPFDLLARPQVLLRPSRTASRAAEGVRVKLYQPSEWKIRPMPEREMHRLFTP
jgi:hypothetical protein